MNDLFQLELDYDPNIKECKGIYFRGYRNVFFSNGRFEEKQGIRFLKRMSCTGCEKCSWLIDAAREEINFHRNTIFPKQIKDGGLYTIRVTNVSKDWETGYVDSYDIEIIEVKE